MPAALLAIIRTMTSRIRPVLMVTARATRRLRRSGRRVRRDEVAPYLTMAEAVKLTDPPWPLATSMDENGGGSG